MLKEEHAKACDQLLSLLITDFTEENYDLALSYYEAAKAAYEALTADEKAMLTVDATLLNTVAQAIDAYEEAHTHQDPDPVTTTEDTPTDAPVVTTPEPKTDDNTTPEPTPGTTKKGCKSAITVSILSLVALSLIPGILVIKRKEE